LPRNLGDVLDYFLPAAGARGGETVRRHEAIAQPPQPSAPAALPIVSLPIGEQDVVRAAYAWNLAVELARAGARATLLAPAEREPSPLWPQPGCGPLGAELVLVDAHDLAELNRAALDVAVARAADCRDGGAVLVRVPPAWLTAGEARALLRWVVLLASPDPRDLLESYGLAKRVFAAHPEARVGVTIHGVRRVADAERAFRRLSDVTGRRLGRALRSYGLLVDDLHVYRAIVARRPIGLEHPQSRAARALGDVARLLLEDARSDPHA
jgi:hypothetical protein